MSVDTKRALLDAERIAREIADSLGLEIVSFVFHGQGRHSQLRIDIDRAGPAGVGLGDCERMSRALDDRLESSGILDTTYELQVSSPGIDRPIRTPDDLRRNAGRRVRVEFRDAADRLVDLRGILAWDADADRIRLSEEGVETAIPRDRIVLMKQDVRPSGRKRRE